MIKARISPLSNFLALTAIAMAVAGCGKSVANQLVGTWAVSKNLSDLSEVGSNRPPEVRKKMAEIMSNTTVTLKPSGVIIIGFPHSHESGNYQLNDHTFTFHFDGKRNRGVLAADGSTITIMTATGAKLVLTKRAP